MSTSDSLPQHISISAIDGQIDTLTESASIRYAIESFIKSQVVDAGKPSPTEVKATWDRLLEPSSCTQKLRRSAITDVWRSRSRAHTRSSSSGTLALKSRLLLWMCQIIPQMLNELLLSLCRGLKLVRIA